MEQVFTLMAIIGAFTFLSMGLCLGNSVEAEESETASDIMVILLIAGILSFLIGFFGILIIWIFF